MVKKFLVIFALLSLQLYSSPDLKEEFDISSYWQGGMSWWEFLVIRNKLEREALVKYVDKIQQQEMAREAGLQVPNTYVVTHEPTPIVDIVSPLSSYVAKMTHLSFSQELMIVKNGVNMLTGEPITPEEVEKRLFKALEMKPREVESWALHQVQPGFMIQEYIPNRQEVKIQTVWGKAVIGEWRGGEVQRATTIIWGRFDREGNRVDGTEEAPLWWPKAVEAAERMAHGTDALRVDFLVREDGELLLNEMEIWPESNWSSMKPVLEAELNEGYRQKLATISPPK